MSGLYIPIILMFYAPLYIKHFNLYNEEILIFWRRDKYTSDINIRVNINSIRLASDMIVLHTTIQKMKEGLKEYGMKIDMAKTSYKNQ